MSAREIRDDAVGAALRELRAPDHRPGFWDELSSALAADAGWGQARLPRPGRPRRRWAVAAVAVAAALIAAVIGLPRSSEPEPALAEVVQARVEMAVGELATLSGRGFYRAENPEPFTGSQQMRFRFAQTAAGDARVEALDAPDVSVYDAERGVERSRNSSASLGGFGRFNAVRSGIPPGPPDSGYYDRFLERQLGAAVRALLAAHDPRIQETTYDGREAWRAVLRVSPNQIVADTDRIDVTIDQLTGLPVRVRTTLEGRFRSILRLSGLRVNDPLPDETFELRFPPDAEVERLDEGFRRVGLDEAEAGAGYPPLVPAAVPPGFELADTAVAERAAPTGAEAANPWSRDVVSLAYRRGFDRFVVTTRLAGNGRWDDPVAAGEGIVEEGRTVTLQRGALAGEEAELVVGPRSIPHLWVESGELVVTVAGELSAAELIDVAESLEAR